MCHRKGSAGPRNEDTCRRAGERERLGPAGSATPLEPGRATDRVRGGRTARPGDAGPERQQSRQQHATEIGVDDPQVGQPSSAPRTVRDVLTGRGGGNGVGVRQQLHQSRRVWRTLGGDAVCGLVSPQVGDAEACSGTLGQGCDGVRRSAQVFGDDGVLVVIDGRTPQHHLPARRQGGERLPHQPELGVMRDRVPAGAIGILEIGQLIGEDVIRRCAAGAVGSLVPDRSKQVPPH